jgi:dihydrofolate reductase
VVAAASMSLDGYIAKADNTIGHLFDWLVDGDVELPTINPDITFHLHQASFDYLQGWVSSLGALVCGRTLFDFTDGWGGRHSMDVPGVVVTHEPPVEWIAAHPDASFEFETAGVEAAVQRAREIAGDRTVAVTAGTIARQCQELGLLAEVAIDLVPVVLGGGRPFFGDLSPGDVPLGDPTTCIPSHRVTHLVYPVRRS